jgi:outer membrane protein OmpA-like peptidoglycan-associated protein
MGQLINIPALKGPIQVAVSVTFGDIGKMRVEDFTDDQTPYDSSLTLPPGNQNTKLKVEAMLTFPPIDRKGGTDSKNMYQQYVYALFPVIIQDDEIRFVVTEKLLQGEPFDPAAQQRSPFRFIEGKAWLSATNNPRYVALKIAMVLGSSDVWVESWESSSEEATWDVSVGGGEKKASSTAGGIIDKVVKWIPKPTIERHGGKTTDTTGGTRTIGQLSQTREWTMLLKLPEPKRKPKPVIYREGFLQPVYFDTDKKEVGNYLEPKKKTDQIKDLMRVMDEQIAKYGAENITGIEVKGYASRLGDTVPNLNLSEGRAKFIADLLKRVYKIKIPEENIIPRGEPLQPGNDKDNSWKDRVVWVSINAVR